MAETESARVTLQEGVSSDFRGRPGRRQVTVLSQEAWQAACAELGTGLPWTTRRANLLVEGLSFGADSVGTILQIGDARLEITGETDPCERMTEAHAGLREALTPDWRGGVCCRVLEAGRISVGDPVSLRDGDPRA
ncbi:MAG: MOSC domain-containing protein [Opitutaceae bacterium]